MTEWIAVTAAVAAALFAGLSWWQSRTSARAARASEDHAASLAHVELERRHDELTPEVTASANEQGYDEDLVRFQLECLGPLNSYDLSVELLPMPKAAVAGLAAARDAENWTTALHLGQVDRGFQVEFWGQAAQRGGDARIEVTLSSPSESWSQLLDVDIDWKPRVY